MEKHTHAQLKPTMAHLPNLYSMADLQGDKCSLPDKLRHGYSVIIRTYNSERTLSLTLDCLDAQTIRPSKVIVVDSGSTDRTLSLLPPNCILHRYTGESFNFSIAINQGLAYVDTEYVAIVSSHTLLASPRALEYGLQLLTDNSTLGAAYFSNEDAPELAHELINSERFDGFNGIWNTASLLRTGLVLSRPFRPEVFSAEDMEWSRWLLEERRLLIARINGSGQTNLNQRHHSVRKQVNERLSLALYTMPEWLRWRKIIRVGLGAFKPTNDRTLLDRKVMLILCCRLILARFVRPKPESRYF